MYIWTYCTSQLQGFRYILFGQDFSFSMFPPHIRTRRNYLKCQRGEGRVNGRSKCLDKVAMSTAWSRKNCDKNIYMLNSSPFSVSCHLFSLFSPHQQQQRSNFNLRTQYMDTPTHTQYTQREREGDRRAQFNSICWANVAFVNRTNRKLQNYSDIDWIAGRRAKDEGWKSDGQAGSTNQTRESKRRTSRGVYICMCVCLSVCLA